MLREALGTLIHEKKPEVEISCQTPFKHRRVQQSLIPGLTMANPMATAARAVFVLIISRDKRQKADFSILLFRGKIFSWEIDENWWLVLC
jgi:hypothetical protein